MSVKTRTVYVTIEIWDTTTVHKIRLRTKADFVDSIVADYQYQFAYLQTGKYLLNHLCRCIYTGDLLPFLECGIGSAAKVYPSFYFWKGYNRIVEVECENLIPAEVNACAPFIWLQVKSEAKASNLPCIRTNSGSSITLFPKYFPDLSTLSLENYNFLRKQHAEVLAVARNEAYYLQEETIHRSNTNLEITLNLYQTPPPSEKKKEV